MARIPFSPDLSQNRTQNDVQADSAKLLFHRVWNVGYDLSIMLPFVIDLFHLRSLKDTKDIPSSPDAAVAEASETPILKTIGWISAGLGAVAIGLIVGRELRQRYKFNRRTPYDFYAHSGDEREIEFGVGI
jgi:hypothetical protein